MLKTFTYDVEINISDENKHILRDFIEQHSDSLKRIYPADYSNASVKAMLGMLGFTYRPVFGPTDPPALRIVGLFCYETDFFILDSLVANLEKRSDMRVLVSRPSPRKVQRP